VSLESAEPDLSKKAAAGKSRQRRAS